MKYRRYYRTLNVPVETHALLLKWKSLQLGGGSIAKFITAAVREKLEREGYINGSLIDNNNAKLVIEVKVKEK